MSHTTAHYDRIKEFMLKTRDSQDPIPNIPTIPNTTSRYLRANMILEEAVETIEALGFKVIPTEDDDIRVARHLGLKPDIEGIADGCADLSVVVTGTLIACGIKDDPLLREVDASNLAKVAGKIIERGDGKIMKPPGWKKPNIKRVLSEQGREW